MRGQQVAPLGAIARFIWSRCYSGRRGPDPTRDVAKFLRRANAIGVATADSQGFDDNRADLALSSAERSFTRVRPETDLLGVYENYVGEAHEAEQMAQIRFLEIDGFGRPFGIEAPRDSMTMTLLPLTSPRGPASE